MKHLDLAEIARLLSGDLKARAYAAAVAEPLDGNLAGTRLQYMAAALSALEKGSGDEAVARDVWDLLAQAIRSPEVNR